MKEKGEGRELKKISSAKKVEKVRRFSKKKRGRQRC